MSENFNIDELLSGYIDGELSVRHQTEVKRLIAHDQDVAERLSRLQRGKELLGALPTDEAPAELLDEVKAKLERRTLLGAEPAGFDRIRGTRHLLMRKTMSLAAMIVLVAMLGLVIYNILSPQPAAVTQQPVAIEDLARPGLRIAESPAAKVAPVEKVVVEPTIVAGFAATLELNTANYTVVDAFVKRAIIDNGLLRYSVSPHRAGDGSYALSCPPEGAAALLTDLRQVWPKLDSVTLMVEDAVADAPVVVKDVTAGQLSQIINQPSPQENVRAAKEFAALNNMAVMMPGKEMFAAIGDKEPQLLTAPRPVLTSNEKSDKKPFEKRDDLGNVNLTIVITGARK